MAHPRSRRMVHRGYRLLLIPALLVLLGLAGGVAVAAAQSRPEIDLRVSPSNYPPQIAVRGVLTDKPFDELLRSGFPARLHVRAELWSIGRWFDNTEGRTEWDIYVKYDVIDRSYAVVRVVNGRVIPLGSYTRLADARAASELPHTAALPAPKAGKRSYVAVVAELQALNVSDLDEVERWLRGEARPAVQGQRNPGTAVTRGVRTLATRLLGGEVRRLETKSPAVRY